MTPRRPRSVPRIHAEATPTSLQDRAALRHPHASYVDSWLALWEVPTGEETSLLRPSRQRMMWRWLLALIIAALCATVGVILLVLAHVEGQAEANPIGLTLAGTAAVIALAAEMTLRPTKGAC